MRGPNPTDGERDSCMQEEQWKRKPHDVTESMAQSLSARAFLCELPAKPKGEAATARHVKVKSLHKQQTTYYGKPIEGALEASSGGESRRRRRDRLDLTLLDLT